MKPFYVSFPTLRASQLYLLIYQQYKVFLYTMSQQHTSTHPHALLPLWFCHPLSWAHILLHWQVMNRWHSSPAIAWILSTILCISIGLIPFWRDTYPECSLGDLALAIVCSFAVLRIRNITAALLDKDDPKYRDVDKSLLPLSLSNYMRQFVLLEPARRTGSGALDTIEHAKSPDPIQATLVSLVHRFYAFTDWLGWNRFHPVARWIIRTLLYFTLSQISIYYLIHHQEDIALVEMELGEVANYLGVDIITAALYRVPCMFTLCYTLYTMMLFAYSALFDLGALILKMERRPDIFLRPWMAGSPRELWSTRWNLIMQGTLTLAFYIPTCRFLNRFSEALLLTMSRYLRAVKRDIKTVSALPAVILRLNRYIAALVVFTASALYHELVVVMVFGSTTFDQLRFFCYQGLLVIIYSIVESICARVLPHTLGWLIGAASLLSMGHWFFRPFTQTRSFKGLLETSASLQCQVVGLC
jgi:hypothetical protein